MQKRIEYFLSQELKGFQGIVSNYFFSYSRDRFGPEDSADNNGSTASTSQNAQSDNTQAGNIPYAGVPYGNGQFPGAGQFGNGPFGTGPFGNAPFGNVPNYGNVPIHSGGHFSSVAGQYDPNTQQTVIYHNYNQKLK